jgi:ABC-type branched-subunit amino acid transport system ATPase component
MRKELTVAFTFQIPTVQGTTIVKLEPGAGAVFVGANGAGKTRLAVEIEKSLGEKAHRIGAHRALALNPEVPKISEEAAMRGLRFGNQHESFELVHREGTRWKEHAAVHLLNDFDFLLQALFAEQGNRALKTHAAARSGSLGVVVSTRLEQLKAMWERLLPTRTLLLSGDRVDVSAGGTPYSAAEMSDGERAVFYMLGQALMAPANAVLVIDEPELHIHPSILGKLWDEVQAAREDCCFVFITHDLNFAAHRLGQKFVIKSYGKGPVWGVEQVPEDTGFDEATVTLILGSRRPVLFVEGTGNSLDSAVFRACFADWTVIPRGSCEEVIHSVVTMRRNASLTRVTCAGLVDADDYTTDEAAAMTAHGVAVLPVSEIENLVLLPAVASVIARSEGLQGDALNNRMAALRDDLITAAFGTIEATVMQHCRRRIDRTLKKIDLSSASTPSQLASEYQQRTLAVDVNALAQEAKKKMETALHAKDLAAVLKYFDGKGPFMAAAAKHLKSTRKDNFEEWLVRVLRTGAVQGLVDAIRQSLPSVVAR